VVRTSRNDLDRFACEVALDGGRVRVWVLEQTDVEPSSLVDAEVQVRGVCGPVSVANRRFEGVVLWTPSRRDLVVAQPPSEPPKVSIKELEEKGSRLSRHRVRVQGVVVSPADGARAVIADGDRRVEVRGSASSHLKPGLRFEVIGFPAKDPGGRLVIEDAVLPSQPEPVSIRPSTARASSPLTTVKQVRSLSREEADRSLRVQVRGVVTLYDPSWDLLFIQDSTAGVYVLPPRTQLSLRTGQLVEVQGVSGSGKFSPIVLHARIKMLGEGALPQARGGTLAEFLSGSEDSQWVEFRGVVHSLESEWRHLTMGVATTGGLIRVSVCDWGERPLPSSMVDAAVRISGVCGTVFNENRQPVGACIYVPSLNWVRVEKPAPENPFALPVQKIGSLLQFSPYSTPPHRLRIQGIATVVREDVFYVQDDGAAVSVRGAAKSGVRPGDLVEVVGFPGIGDYSPVIEEALVRKTGIGLLPKPRSVRAGDALQGAHDARFIRLDGRLMDVFRRAKGVVLTLQSEGVVFDVHPATAETAQALSRLPVGSLLRVTGACVVQVDQWRRPRAFSVFVNSPADVAILYKPPWWTLENTLLSLAVLSVVVLAAFGWIWFLRRRVRRQTELIRQRLEREAALEERYRRLFETAGELIQSVATDGRLLFANPAWRKTLGYEDADISGISVFDIVAPEHVKSFREVFQKLIEGSQTDQIETAFVTRNGRRVVVEGGCHLECAEGKPISVQGIFRDITERKRAEAELTRELDFNSTMARLSKTLLSGESVTVESMTRLVLEQAKRLTGSLIGHVDYIHPLTGELVSPHLQSQDAALAAPLSEAATAIRWDSGRSWLERLQDARQRRVEAAADSGEGRADSIVPAVRPRLISAPAMIGERVVGQVTVANPHEEYTDYDLKVITRLASLYAVALERKWMEQRLWHLSTHDALTGLYNRTYFEEELARLEHSGTTPVSIAVVDVDGLKSVNDRDGHAAGDELLKRTAVVLKSAARAEDVVSRIGGDEFAIILAGVHATAAEGWLARLRQVLDRHNRDYGGAPLGFGTGIMTGEKGKTLVEVLKEADLRMYGEKLARSLDANRQVG
jgi:diguanylate cyclase (GGDEF)-like protein/PAS domain S-box-containing protein